MARQHVQVDADEIAYLKVIPSLEKWSKKMYICMLKLPSNLVNTTLQAEATFLIISECVWKKKF